LLVYPRDPNDMRIVGRRQSAAAMRAPTISFNVEGRDPAKIVLASGEARLGIRFGDFHRLRLVEALVAAERSRVVRLSRVSSNGLDKFDRLIARHDKIL